MPRTTIVFRTFVAAVIIAMVAPLFMSGPPVAVAADLSQFDAGNIISDVNFFNSAALSPQVTAAFIAGKGSACLAGVGGPPCLKDYRQSTPDRGGDAYCPGGYSGRTAEPASDIVWKVAQGCGLNPAVLLVLLEKESGLIRSPGPGQDQYDTAMGQGCPDTAGCDAYYTGFFNQVYGAAAQFQRYRINAGNYGYRAGVVNNILYNPNRACGSSPVFIANQATAGLYNFTPYQPNAASLAAGSGTGDACSAYGNRNFWTYFTNWFGPTTRANSAPSGFVDAVTWAVNSAGSGTVTVRGWAADPDTSDSIAVHAYLDDQGTSLVANTPRPDVNATLGTTGDHGFVASLPTSNGRHRVCLYAIDATFGPNTSLGCTVVGNHPPVGSVDSVTWSPSYLGPGSVTVRGWALDPDDPTVSAADALYVDGHGVTGTADQPRPDVNQALGVTGQHGFVTNFSSGPGQHQVCVYAVDTSGGPSSTLQCQPLTTNARPVGSLDALSVANGTLTLQGWAIDQDTTMAIGVAVYIDGVGVNVVQADKSRQDVARAYPGAGDQHGFTTSTPIAAGAHLACAYGLDTAAGENGALGCTAFTA